MKKIIFVSILLVNCFFINAQQEEVSEIDSDTYRFMSYNIRNARGMDEVTDYKRIASVIESAMPDIVVLQELDSVTTRSHNADVLKNIADIVKMHHVYAPAISFQGGKYGIGLLSKQCPLSWKYISLPGKEEKRTLLIAEFDTYVIFGSHFSLTPEDRLSSVEIINEQARLYNKPLILMGDLNAAPNSDVIAELSHSWEILNNTAKATFPADRPTVVIDYIMRYRDGGQVCLLKKAQVMDEPLASDHRPLFVDIQIPD